ncbi:MAG: carbonic anhydrase [Prochlorococcaceae cyanobacterium]
MALARRELLRSAGLLAAALGLGASAGPAAAAALEPDPGEDALARLQRRLEVCRPEGDPLQELLRRNRAFAAVWQEAEASGDPIERAELLHAHLPLQCQVRPDALAEGQRPWAAVLCCADSRVAPEWIFAAGSGELFEVRSAGNTAFDAGIASLEYAVAELAVPLILVLGHSGCGAVKAARSDAPLTPLLEELVQPIRAALPRRGDLAAAVQANARAAAAALGERSALLAEAVAAGSLRIQPAYLDIGSARVTLL